MTEVPSEQSNPKSLAEIIGYEVDAMAYGQAILPRLERRGINLEEFAWQELVRHSDIVRKAGRHGERAPVASQLPEVNSRLVQAVAVGDLSTYELLEHLAYFQQEVVKIRDFYDD